MRAITQHRAPRVAPLLSLLLAACASSATPDAGVSGGDVDVATTADTATPPSDAADTTAEDTKGGFEVCVPGTPKECVGQTPTFTVLQCSPSGTDYIEQTCKDAEGKDVWCLNGACAECIPGSKSCKDDDIIVECDETGHWQPTKTCSQEKTGQICQGGTCVALCEVNKKFNSYIGCEYWAVDLDNAFVPGGPNGFLDANGAQFAVVIGNPHPKQAAEIKVKKMEGGQEVPQTVDSKGVEIDPTPIEPGGLRIYNLPRRDAEGTMLAPIAYRIESSIPVTAYQFNPLENVNVFSNDASLLLPSDVLGKYYIVMTREQTFSQLRGFLTVVAVNDGTDVTVTVTAPTLQKGSIKHMKPGDSLKVTMNRYDVLNIETDEPGADLTGSVVLATRNVVVFGGSEASNAPNTARCDKEPGEAKGVCMWDGKTECATLEDCIKFNTCCADHLEQQLFPVKTWGTYYVATKSMERGKEKDIWRILAAEDDTKVSLYPPQPGILLPVLNRGEWVEFESSAHFEIVAKKPVMVGQFLAAQDAPDPNVNGVAQPGDAGTGDPAFILAVPVEQYRKEYVVLAPNKYEFDYLNVTAPVGAKVFIDGEEVPAEDFEAVSSAYRVHRRLIADGDHSITSDKPVGVIVYGYDQYVSYGYPGGLDLRDLGLIKETGE
ncbi:MAG: hypothetical protein AMXMBFR64_02010 [Myxococcales bacterium]